MKRKRLFAACFAILLLTAGWLYYLYQKPRADVAKIKAAFHLSAESLYRDFATNEATANQKYTGNIIEVKGVVSDAQRMDSSAFILLAAGNEMGGINCSVRDPGVVLPLKDETVTVKGRCTGFLMDVNLVDAVIIQ